LDKCDTVIGWGIGSNQHNPKVWNIGVTTEKTNFDKFKLLGVRDFDNDLKLRYVPCVSCLSAELEWGNTVKPEEKFGIIEHKDLHLNVISENFKINRINNSFNLYDICQFIARHECIITNSYHIAYWTTLMDRKCIVANPFSTKFNHLKYKPALLITNSAIDASACKCEHVLVKEGEITMSDLDLLFEKCRNYPDALAESRALNLGYFAQVRQYTDKLLGSTAPLFRECYLANRLSSFWLSNTLRDSSNRINYLQNELNVRSNSLHAELYSAVDRKFKEFELKHPKRLSLYTRIRNFLLHK